MGEGVLVPLFTADQTTINTSTHAFLTDEKHPLQDFFLIGKEQVGFNMNAELSRKKKKKVK
jgi:hypothetical protein